ncbi:hypothetical protein M2243_001302 [Heliophilum fasciatum]|nr:hypothetical protein [Heliophilum fasciatum]
MYVNGEFVGTKHTGIQSFTTTEDLVLGAIKDTWVKPMKGKMDEVRIYRRALTIDEIRRLGMK